MRHLRKRSPPLNTQTNMFGTCTNEHVRTERMWQVIYQVFFLFYHSRSLQSYEGLSRSPFIMPCMTAVHDFSSKGNRVKFARCVVCRQWSKTTKKNSRCSMSRSVRRPQRYRNETGSTDSFFKTQDFVRNPFGKIKEIVLFEVPGTENST